MTSRNVVSEGNKTSVNLVLREKAAWMHGKYMILIYFKTFPCSNMGKRWFIRRNSKDE